MSAIGNSTKVAPEASLEPVQGQQPTERKVSKVKTSGFGFSSFLRQCAVISMLFIARVYGQNCYCPDPKGTYLKDCKIISKYIPGIPHVPIGATAPNNTFCSYRTSCLMDPNGHLPHSRIDLVYTWTIPQQVPQHQDARYPFLLPTYECPAYWENCDGVLVPRSDENRVCTSTGVSQSEAFRQMQSLTNTIRPLWPYGETQPHIDP